MLPWYESPTTFSSVRIDTKEFCEKKWSGVIKKPDEPIYMPVKHKDPKTFIGWALKAFFD